MYLHKMRKWIRHTRSWYEQLSIYRQTKGTDAIVCIVKNGFSLALPRFARAHFIIHDHIIFPILMYGNPLAWLPNNRKSSLLFRFELLFFRSVSLNWMTYFINVRATSLVLWLHFDSIRFCWLCHTNAMPDPDPIRIQNIFKFYVKVLDIVRYTWHCSSKRINEETKHMNPIEKHNKQNVASKDERPKWKWIKNQQQHMKNIVYTFLWASRCRCES